MRFPKGRWHFDPSSLKSLNLDVDGVNELKANDANNLSLLAFCSSFFFQKIERDSVE